VVEKMLQTKTDGEKMASKQDAERDLIVQRKGMVREVFGVESVW
jgi:hypothetical protein